MYKKVATLLFSLSLITAPFMGNCQFLKQLVTAKFTPGGEVAWERYAGDNLGRTTVRGICTDVNSNVYITGNSTNGIWFGDTWFGCYIFVTKYSPIGSLLWAKPITGSSMKISAIAADSEENCYVVGRFSSLLVSDTIRLTGGYPPLTYVFIIKYNKNGETVWAKSSLATGYGLRPNGISINEKYGHIYITGYDDDDGPYGNNTKLFVAKYNLYSGSLIKNVEIYKNQEEPHGYGNAGYGIVNNEEYVYVSGSIGTPNGHEDIYIAKLDTGLNILWDRNPAETTLQNIAYDLTLDEENNIYVIGFFKDSIQMGGQLLKTIGYQDIFIAKYSDDGDLTWAKNAGNPEWWSSDNSWSISYDKYKSCLYLSGYVEENSSFPPGIQTTHQGPFLARMGTDGDFEKVSVSGQIMNTTMISGEGK